MLRRMILELDEDDYDAIQREIARRQAQRDAKGMWSIPEGESNLAGAVLAETCRAWQEYIATLAAGE